MCSNTYCDFGEFVIHKSQKEMFIALQQYKLPVYEQILNAVHEKAEVSPRQSLVTIFGDFQDGNCPRLVKNYDEFTSFSDFKVSTNVQPEIHSSTWITESISVTGHAKTPFKTPSQQ